MEEKRYKISDASGILASWMKLDDALLFIQAYCERYFNEVTFLTLEEEPSGVCENSEE